jgi:hypothetical protein
VQPPVRSTHPGTAALVAATVVSTVHVTVAGSPSTVVSAVTETTATAPSGVTSSSPSETVAFASRNRDLPGAHSLPTNRWAVRPSPVTVPW